ncbi:MAG: DUF305 domain-containing protein [Bacteroidetes bacterium]|nr:DUF305 domain-containing protein [Bacteroidota bacterium]
MQVSERHFRAQHYFLHTVVFLVLLVTSACRSTESITTDSAIKPSADTTADLEALYWARKDSARTLFTDADVEFMTGMIGHHAQALIMAGLAPTHGANTQIQTLCARIINAQQDEIATMQQWLRSRGQPVPEVQITGTTLIVHGAGEHVTRMPGMLTEKQIHELDDSQGADFDRLFLTYMIQHHRGATVMVDELFSKDGAGQDELAFKLASDINVDQITEIARMERMLRILTGKSPDH